METNRRKALYIVISIVLAILVWFYVSNSDTVTVAINDVPIEFLHEELGLANKGLMLISGDDATVDLELTMPRSLVYSFDTDKVRLVADLNAVTGTGTQTLSYSILYPNNINASRVSVKSPSYRTTEVQIGELFRRNIEIRCKLVGNVASGYVAGAPQLLPEQLEIRGQQEDIMSVSYAQVSLSIDDAQSTVIQMLSFELYDENDQLVTSTRIHPASSAVQVTVPVIAAKELPLRINFVESAGVRLSSFDYTLDHESISVSGDAGVLAELDEILLDTIDLSALGAEEFTETYAIQLPENVRNLSGIGAVTLTIRARDLAEETYEVTRFGYENYEGEDEVTVLTSSMPVTLRGARDTLDALSAGRIRISADLSNISGAHGNYTVPALIEISGDPDVGVIGSYEVTVHVGELEPEEPTDEPGAEGSGNTEGGDGA